MNCDQKENQDRNADAKSCGTAIQSGSEYYSHTIKERIRLTVNGQSVAVLIFLGGDHVARELGKHVLDTGPAPRMARRTGIDEDGFSDLRARIGRLQRRRRGWTGCTAFLQTPEWPCGAARLRNDLFSG